MPSKYWIKLFHEILHDRKMVQLSDHLYRRAIEIFLMAGDENQDGLLPTLGDMAFTVRVADPEFLETDLRELGRIGIVEQREGRWNVTNFSKRQEKMSKAEYMKRLRDQRKKDNYYQPSDQPVTNSNTDTDTDTDKKRKETEESARGNQRKIPPLPDYLMDTDFMNAWGEWRQHQLEGGKEITWATATRQYEQFRQWGIPRAIAAMEYSMGQGYTGLYEPKGQSSDGQQEPAGFPAIRKIKQEIEHGNT